MEHASIAAFARFALDLMALGAPPELLEDTHQALKDETHHARLAFGLASAYAGRGVGPGPMPLRGALSSEGPVAIVGTAFLEACVGETCAAIEAAEAAARATDPAVAAVLRRIAVDETRHAELGWRFVRWAIDTLGQNAREAVERALSATVASVAGVAECDEHSVASESDPLIGHGALPAPLRAAIRKAALADAVIPCARALLGVSQAVAA